MFTLAMEAKARDMGVVGSTSNILDFIAGKLSAALQQPYGERLRFVLGTEAGMITSIVRKVQSMLKASCRSDVEVEVVFPVNPSAITTTQQQTAGGAAELPLGLSVVPGPAGGEGCSLEGGCASCPFMKMNTLSALMTVAQRVGEPAGEAMLEAFKPKAYTDRIDGKTMAQAGCIPILHMRHFTQHKQLSEELVQDIKTRH
jgi:quinolinate synthase